MLTWASELGYGVIVTATLPCSAFPITESRARPVRSADAGDASTGAPILSEPAPTEMIELREITLQARTMDPARLAILEAAYDNGRGLVQPFWFTPPGYATERQWVFKDPLAVTKSSPTKADASYTLIDVTTVPT